MRSGETIPLAAHETTTIKIRPGPKLDHCELPMRVLLARLMPRKRRPGLFSKRERAL